MTSDSSYDAADDSLPPTGPRGGPSLTSRTASGFAWLAGRTVATKALAFISQIVLAYLLLPDDFGLVGLAYTFAAFANLASQAGLRQVLIHEHDRFAERYRPAFWLGATGGLAGAALILAFAPLAVAVYNEPRLWPVMLTLALAPPIEALGVAPRARIEASMRFRFLAGVEVSVAVIQAGLSIALAASGFGALSFVIPRPVVGLLRTAALWIGSGVGWPGGPTTKGWRELVRGSAAVLVAMFAYTATAQGDYLVLGLMYEPALVGLYYFAFNLSMQSVALLTTNLQAVLLPALSHLKAEPKRQAEAMVRASAALALLSAPVAMWLAVAGGPIIRLIFDPKWAASAPIFSILSLAMIGRTVAAPAANLTQAQGRFSVFMRTHIIAACLFFPLVAIGAWQGGGVGAAVAVLIHSGIHAGLFLRAALADQEMTPLRAARTILAPVAAGALAFSLAFGLSLFAPLEGPLGDALRLVGTLVVGGGCYAVLARLWAKRSWVELRKQIASRLPSRLTRRAAIAN